MSVHVGGLGQYVKGAGTSLSNAASSAGSAISRTASKAGGAVAGTTNGFRTHFSNPEDDPSIVGDIMQKLVELNGGSLAQPPAEFSLDSIKQAAAQFQTDFDNDKANLKKQRIANKINNLLLEANRLCLGGPGFLQTTHSRTSISLDELRSWEINMLSCIDSSWDSCKVVNASDIADKAKKNWPMP